MSRLVRHQGMMSALMTAILKDADIDYNANYSVTSYRTLGLVVKLERNVIRDLEMKVDNDHPRANVVEYRYVLHGRGWCMRMNQRTEDMIDEAKAETRSWEIDGDEDQCLTDLSILRLSGVEDE